MYPEYRIPLKATSVFPAILLVFLSMFCYAQDDSTVENVVRTALERNRSITAGRLDVSAREALRKTAREVPKTTLTAMLGQYNSYKFDQNFTINQTIPNPRVFGARASVLASQVKSSQMQLTVSENDLCLQVKSLWYELAYLKELDRYLAGQDSLYADFARAAEVRRRTGSTGSLEPVIAETRLRQVQTQRRQNEANQTIVQQRLQALLFTETPVRIADATLSPRAMPDTASSQNPLVAWYAQQVRVAEAEKRLQEAARLPEYSFGYFNQSLIGTARPGTSEAANGLNRFHGFQAGISFPLFGKALKARVESARITEQALQSQFEQQERNVRGDISALVAEAGKLRQTIEYYRSSALPQAVEIIRQANLGFQAGGMGYVEYLQGLSTANDLRIGYLQAVNDYNQLVVRLEHTLGVR